MENPLETAQRLEQKLRLQLGTFTELLEVNIHRAQSAAETAERLCLIREICDREESADKANVKLLIDVTSCWIGVHYSKYNKRVCINVVPFVTVCVTLKGGRLPRARA